MLSFDQGMQGGIVRALTIRIFNASRERISFWQAIRVFISRYLFFARSLHLSSPSLQINPILPLIHYGKEGDVL